MELLGGYSRHHYALEALRKVGGRSDTKGTSNNRLSARPVHRHKIEQRLPADTIAQITADYQGGITTPALAKQYNISTTAVKRLLHVNAVLLRRYHRLSEQEIAQAAELYRAGWSLAKLGRKLDVDDETIRKRLKEVGVLMRSPGGYRNG